MSATTSASGSAGTSTRGVSIDVVREGLRFLRRCWTGEDITTATTIGGCALLVAIVWIIETLVSTGLRTVGVIEPLATITGWMVAGAYVVLGAIHDWRALQRRTEREMARLGIRLALARVGLERVVRERGRVTDTDLDSLGEPRRLWRIEDARGDDLLVAVEVVNSSPGPDGLRSVHFLRVPPGIRTCRAAVAWTFGLEADIYEPAVET
jgi:hypothetical protein